MKRTLIVAALLVVCLLTTAIGGTIAWFTDEAASQNNIIQSGTLDVDVLVDGTSIAAMDTLFSDVTLWEPGAVAFENLTVQNLGSLAFKYKLSMNAGDYNNVDGNDLTGALKVGFVEGGIAAGTDRAGVIASVTEWFTFDDFKAEGALLPEGSTLSVADADTGSAVCGVVVYWQPTANDNDWNVNNGKQTTGGNDPKPYLYIDLGVKVEATQLMAESDSFDNEYDEGAFFPVSTVAELQEALNKGEKVSLAEDLTLTEPLTVPAGVEAAISLNGKTITAAMSRSDGNGLIMNNGTLTIYGDGASAITSTAPNGTAVLCNTGVMVINGGSYIGAANSDDGYSTYAITTNGTGAQLTLNNVSISGRGAVAVTNGAEATLNGGTYHTPLPNWGHAVYASGDGAKVTINDGIFSEGYEYAPDLWGMYQIYAGGGALVEVNDGTFLPWDCANGYDLATGGDGQILIYGGTFADNPSSQYNKNFVATGYEAVQNADGSWTVVQQ